MEEVFNLCKKLLDTSEECKQYIKSRQIDKNNVYNFGYFPTIDEIKLLSDNDKNILINHKLLYEKLIDDNLGPRKIYSSYYEHHRLVIPYKNSIGEIVGLVARTFLNEEDRKKINVQKYKNTRFKINNYLFGLDNAKKDILRAGYVYVVEGQIDAITAQLNGMPNTVSINGAGMNREQFIILARYTDSIFLLLDNDEAGKNGRIEIKNKYSKYLKIKDCFIPKEYKDVDGFLLAETKYVNKID